jgi:hypothetical protein
MNNSHKIINSDPRPYGEKVFISKDASCQTSDCELLFNRKSEDEKNILSNNNKPKRHYSDHRRATDSLLQGGGHNEANRSLVKYEVFKIFRAY